MWLMGKGATSHEGDILQNQFGLANWGKLSVPNSHQHLQEKGPAMSLFSTILEKLGFNRPIPQAAPSPQPAPTPHIAGRRPLL